MTTAQVQAPASSRRVGDPAAGGFGSRVVAGAGAVFTGLGLVVRDSQLFVLSLVPMGVHLGLFVLWLWLGFTKVAPPLLAWAAPANNQGAWALVAGVVVVVVYVVVVLASLVLTLLSGSVLCDPFYDLLSERTEELFVGRSVGPAFSVGSVVRGLVRELVANVLRLLVWGVVAVPLWLLSLTPLSLVAVPLSLLWTWLFFAYEYLSRSLARHAVDPKHRFAPIFAHKALCLGFGGAAWLISFVPFLAPILVVAATRLYLGLAVYDRVPSTYTAGESGPEILICWISEGRTCAISVCD